MSQQPQPGRAENRPIPRPPAPRPPHTPPPSAPASRTAPRTAPRTEFPALPGDAGTFHNPYAFVPAPPRDAYQLQPDDPDAPGLGDALPVGHHRLHEQLWTGRIGVKLTVITPLLVLDPSRATIDPDSKHATYPVLRRDGSPHLASTAVKGMLRAAYEAATNSRLSVFVDHDNRLGTRMNATDAQLMVPARVSDDGQQIVLMPGDTPPGDQTRPNSILHAAWLPMHGAPGPAVIQPPGFVVDHENLVDAEVELIQHHRWDKTVYTADFRMWRVRTIAPTGTPLPAATPYDLPAKTRPHSWYEPTGPTKVITAGRVMLTGRNFGKKHDERIFFTDRQPEQCVPLTRELRQQWDDVIADYQAVRRTSEPATWSKHLTEPNRTDLRPGQMCYAQWVNGKVTALYPVMIGRQLHKAAPVALLPPSSRPADTLEELSPADRVFGWVADGDTGAHRGQLRIGPVTCPQGATAVEDTTDMFGPDGVPLAILGQPKPQQARFYVAKSAAEPHKPLPEKTLRQDWYVRERGLRGRKVYPHHAGLPDDHWRKPIEDRTQTVRDGRYQEYRRPRQGLDDGRLREDRTAYQTSNVELRDEQNRSIRGWVKPNTIFRFDIDVTNLSPIELGALIWLLRLPAGECNRVGYGKPLGFGSVRLDLQPDRTILRSGREWLDYYRTLVMDDTARIETELLDTLQQVFETVMNDQTIVAAIHATAAGDANLPIHYPRTRPSALNPTMPAPPDPRGRNFAWFTNNERGNQGAIRIRRALPGTGGTPLDIYTERA
jgi:CRISPR-associated protein (TIGR03986 family)